MGKVLKTRMSFDLLTVLQEFLDELDKDLDGLVSMEEYRNVFRDLFTTTSEDDSDTSNEDFLSFQKEYDTNNDQMFDKV